jgi:hypothetical protein
MAGKMAIQKISLSLDIAAQTTPGEDSEDPGSSRCRSAGLLASARLFAFVTMGITLYGVRA